MRLGRLDFLLVTNMLISVSGRCRMGQSWHGLIALHDSVSVPVVEVFVTLVVVNTSLEVLMGCHLMDGIRFAKFVCFGRLLFFDLALLVLAFLFLLIFFAVLWAFGWWVI